MPGMGFLDGAGAGIPVRSMDMTMDMATRWIGSQPGGMAAPLPGLPGHPAMWRFLDPMAAGFRGKKARRRAGARGRK